jgi:hypothetical protein
MSDAAWERWDVLRSTADADPIEVLEVVAHFQKYFAAIEREAIRVARAQGRTWSEIGAALGRTRQAIWQRAGSGITEEVLRMHEESWTRSAEVHFKIGAKLP